MGDFENGTQKEIDNCGTEMQEMKEFFTEVGRKKDIENRDIERKDFVDYRDQTDFYKGLINRVQWSRGSFLLLGRGEEGNVDVGEDTTGGNGGTTHKLVELVVVSDGHLDVSGDDSGSLEILGGVSGKLEDLSCEVLEDGGEVDGGSGSNSGGEFTGLHVSGDSSDGELESSSLGSADGTSGTSLSFSFSSSTGCGHYLFI